MSERGAVTDSVPRPLLGPADLDRLRTALACYTADAVDELLGLAGQAALGRGDLAGVARVLAGSAGSPLTTLITLFVLGREAPESAVRAALHPLALESAAAAGFVTVSAGWVRAELDLRPYSETRPIPVDGGADGRFDGRGAAPAPWWVVSDLGSDVRPGPLATDHVLGIGRASLTLAQATPRAAVGRALDIGTGCGVQALHLTRHSERVTATDVSARALRLAATTAALSGQQWDLRAGSLLTPVGDESFDLVVANPPFVVSSGSAGYDYRDSGLAGDAVCESLLRNLPGVLTADGCAVILANWIIPRDGSWQERVGNWLAGRGCDAWVWQREVAEVGEYVALWLRDAGEIPGSERWNDRYDSWCGWFDSAGVAAVGMGMATLWRTSSEAVVVLEDVPQAVGQPVAPELPAWLARQRWLAVQTDTTLLESRLWPAKDVVRTRDDVLTENGWTGAAARLRLSHGLRWELEVDDAVASIVAACDGRTPLRVGVGVLAAALDASVVEITEALLPVVRDLVGRGFLHPGDPSSVVGT